MVHKNWSITLDEHFFYTKELLLGVKIWPKPAIRVQKKSKPKTRLWQFLTVFLLVLLISFAGVFTFPNLYYQVFPASTIELKPDVLGTPLGGSFESRNQVASSSASLPPQDLSLPKGDWVLIPKIGVETTFLSSKNPDEALKTGAWLEPDYGKPGDTGLPIIIAAHRFGWSWWWQSDYWRYHSFYLLPETKPGVLVELISDQRKWSYEIFAAEEGEEITNYDADLILYTCKHLSSPLRHIRYARLIDTTELSFL